MKTLIIFAFLFIFNYGTTPIKIKSVILAGKVIDQQTQLPVSTNITFKNARGVWIAKSDEKGEYTIKLPCKRAYACEVVLDNYRYYLKSIYFEKDHVHDIKLLERKR